MRKSRIRFEPALEGLRGLSLLAMLCFHSEFSWAVGGFLPVSTFFTLSGFLITALFLKEQETTGRIDLPAFWARRFRRLMPASLLALGGIVLFGAFVATADQLEGLRDDVLWALMYVANWRFYLTDTAYANLFVAPSPVQHFWSLAIEEQFYLAYPLLVVAGLRLGSGSRLGLGCTLAAATLLSVVASVALMGSGSSIDRVYYGTDARAAELVLGGLLAVVMAGRDLQSRRLQRLFVTLGSAALVATLALWATVHLESAWLYRGGFAAYALLSVAVLMAGIQPFGPVRVFLSWAPMRWVGKVSYGAYLFHWPLFLWLSPERLGIEGLQLFAIRVAATLFAAGLSYELLESPIRSGRALRGWRPFAVAPLAVGLVGLGAVGVTGVAQRQTTDLGLARSVMEEAPGSRVAGSAEKPPGIAVFGDSTAFLLNQGLVRWLRENGGRPLPGVAKMGCGIVREGHFKFRRKLAGRRKWCLGRDEEWAQSLEQHGPDVVVVMAGPWDVSDRLLPRDETWRAPGDPVLDRYLQAELVEAADLLASRGALVIWLTSPIINVHERGGEVLPKEPYPVSDPARMARLNEMIFALEKLRPGAVRVVDFAGYLRGLPGGELDARLRPDGTHLTRETAYEISRDWLGEEILRVYGDASGS